jgi:Ser/Thr protein kinase RdoA (MazF antagonist)
MNDAFNHVLNQYPYWVRGTLLPLAYSNGFSGARLWRLEDGTNAYCLKAWPTNGPSRERLSGIHQLLARSPDLPWMPRVVPTIHGATLVECQGRLWDMTTWMPGEADFTSIPSTTRLEAACSALAQLHLRWAAKPTIGIGPGVERRMQSWQEWSALLQSGWRPRWTAFDPYATISEPLFQAVQQQGDTVPRLLSSWRNVRLPLQSCVCDPWRAHVLFTDDIVTGWVDFGSVKFDHVAVDLARLLGSFLGDDRARWQIGINSYKRVRNLSDAECRLAHDLDITGTLVAATHWLRWLYHDPRRYEQPRLVLERLQQLATRLAK